MRSIIYKCDICGKEYPYANVQVVDKERGVLLRIPDLGVEICIKCKKQLKEAILALKQHYAN